MPDDLSLATVFEQLPNAIMVVDRRLRFVAANAAYLRVTGSTREGLIGQPLFDLFPDDPEDPAGGNAARLRASFERVIATRAGDELAAITYRVAREPGGPLEERIWSAKHTPILDAEGEVAYIIQETADVSHLRERSATSLETTVLDRAQRAQAAASSLDLKLKDLRQMFEQAPGFMCFLRGRHHTFEIVNSAYRQLVGHRDVVGMTVAEALPEVVAQGFIALLDRVFATGAPFLGTAVPIQLQRAPGAELEPCVLDFIYQPIRGADGAVVGIFVQGQDVTSQHLAEAQRRAATDELQARVAYEQRLIGIVSHDLRNPVSAIKLSAASLAGAQLPAASQRAVTRVTRAADRAARLIADLLDFARARIGTAIPINPRPANLRELIEQVVDELQVGAPGRAIRVSHAGPEDGAWDVDRMAQVISNLVGNAIQHGTPSAAVAVESRIAGDAATLVVANPGPPIPAEELARMFEPFQRGSNAAAASGSMGLGLFIAREVVAAHGGTIEVASRPGEGTTFTVRLPRFV